MSEFLSKLDAVNKKKSMDAVKKELKYYKDKDISREHIEILRSRVAKVLILCSDFTVDASNLQSSYNEWLEIQKELTDEQQN